MLSPRTKGNLAMGADKVFAGLNANALRYLMPTWMSPVSGSALRVCFGAVAFWAIGLFTRREATPVDWRMKGKLLLIGFIVFYGFTLTYLLALNYTTPLTVILINCTEPVWVLLMAAVMLHVKITKFKVLGIFLGIGGALVCLLGQKSSGIASNPTLGILMAALSSILYSLYLVLTKGILEKVDIITFNKWTFSGAAMASLLALPFFSWYAPVLHKGLFSGPMLALLFVLFIPSVLDYYLSSVGLKCLSATTVAIYGYLKIVIVMVVGYIVGQDRFEWYQILAIVLIVASVYFVEIAKSKSKTATVPGDSNGNAEPKNS